MYGDWVRKIGIKCGFLYFFGISFVGPKLLEAHVQNQTSTTERRKAQEHVLTYKEWREKENPNLNPQQQVSAAGLVVTRQTLDAVLEFSSSFLSKELRIVHVVQVRKSSWDFPIAPMLCLLVVV
ncbi:hypothetical protein PanWU01x14_188460 [Parasponia andersonii]|uniref:Uncharacterized protein n=1 Tax=Parasponia andersonii TaxID=3476 RepID=A0A2P5C2S1_PARAD|nr:hypothetical protein PanWU01x14_188460 [Parasponia andersonii]